MASRSRHSRYWRRLKDLPLQGASVTIKLQLGRWRCRNRKCERKIFTERVPGVLVPHAQHTVRLGEIRMLVGRGLGGRPGERLMSRLGMAASRHTLLRQVIRAARGCALTDVIRVVGVDDWAWSKGQSFGTILVDLERGEVVDLLPTRSADSLCDWLTQHPEVVVVSRDRHGIYAEYPHTAALAEDGGRKEPKPGGSGQFQRLETAVGSGTAGAAREVRAVSDDSENAGLWLKGEPDREPSGYQPKAH